MVERERWGKRWERERGNQRETKRPEVKELAKVP